MATGVVRSRFPATSTRSRRSVTGATAIVHVVNTTPSVLLGRRELLRRTACATLVGAVVAAGLHRTVSAASDGISMVGDSLTAGTQSLLIPAFESQGFASAQVSACGGRGVRTKMTGDPLTGVAAVDDLRARGGDTEAWVIALGTNDSRSVDASRYQELIVQMMDTIGAGHRVLWIDIAFLNDSGRTRRWNDALAAVAAGRDDMYVHSWSNEIAAHPAWYLSDGVHYTSSGSRARVASVTAASKALQPVTTRAERVAAGVATLHPIAAPGRFSSTGPRRVLDTRVDGEPLAAAGWRQVDLSAAVPGDAIAVAVGLTVVEPASDGFVTALRSRAEGVPTVSTVDVTAGLTTAAHAVVATTDATIWVFSGCDADLVVDVQGWYGPDGAWGVSAMTPTRLFDSREVGDPLGPGQRITLQVPPIGGRTARAAVLQLTATSPTGAGYLTVGPAGAAPPPTSDLNISMAATTVTNGAHVLLSDTGCVELTAWARAHVVVDLVAVLDDAPDAWAFTPVEPVRVLDTRDGTGGWSGELATGQALDVTVPTDAAALVGMLATTRARRNGYLAVRSSDTAPSGTSNLNPTPNRLVSSTFMSVLAAGGRMTVDQGDGGGEHVLIDVVGVWS